MNNPGEHTFDDHACLTRRQVKDYLSAAMSPEEVAAAEQHFNSCPLCKEAMEGYLANSDKALEALSGLSNEVLNGQIGAIQQQQMHEAKIVPILTKPAKRKKRAGQPASLNSLVPMFVLVGVFALFRYEQGNSHGHYRPIQHVAAKEPKPEKSELATAYAKPAPSPKVSSINYPDEPVARITKVDAPAAQPTPAPTPGAKPAAAGSLPIKIVSPHDTAVVRKPATGGTAPIAKHTTKSDTALAHKASLPLAQLPKPAELKTSAAPPPIPAHKPAFGPAEYGHDTPVIKQNIVAPKASTPKATVTDTGGGHTLSPGD